MQRCWILVKNLISPACAATYGLQAWTILGSLLASISGSGAGGFGSVSFPQRYVSLTTFESEGLRRLHGL